MSEITDLVVIEKTNALAVFTSQEQLDPLIEAIEKEARSLVPDLSTKKAATLSHLWRIRLHARRPISTTLVKTS